MVGVLNQGFHLPGTAFVDVTEIAESSWLLNSQSDRCTTQAAEDIFRNLLR